MNASELKRRCADEIMKSLAAGRKLEDIRTDSLCQSAGVSRAGFYRSFRDKFDLIEWIFNDLLVFRVTGGTFVENYLQGTCESLQIIRDNRAFFEAILEYRGQNAFTDTYYLGIFRDSEIRLNDSTKAAFFASGTVRIVTEWIRSGCSQSPERLAELLNRFLQVLKSA